MTLKTRLVCTHNRQKMCYGVAKIQKTSRRGMCNNEKIYNVRITIAVEGIEMTPKIHTRKQQSYEVTPDESSRSKPHFSREIIYNPPMAPDREDPEPEDALRRSWNSYARSAHARLRASSHPTSSTRQPRSTACRTQPKNPSRLNCDEAPSPVARTIVLPLGGLSVAATRTCKSLSWRSSSTASSRKRGREVGVPEPFCNDMEKGAGDDADEENSVLSATKVWGDGRREEEVPTIRCGRESP